MGIRLVVNADDLGVRADVDAGILEAHDRGVVTSSTALAGGAAFAATAARLRGTKLGLGVHLALSGDLPTCAPASDVPALLDPDTGRLPRKWPVAAAKWLTGRLPAEQVRREWEAQLARALDHGLAIDHVDSHEHVHAFPGLWEQAVLVAARFGIRRLRRPVEPPFGPGPLGGGVKRLAISLATRASEAASRGYDVRTPATCHGLAATGVLDRDALLSILDRLGPGEHELVCHPGRYDGTTPHDGPMDLAWLRSRPAELAALCDPDVLDLARRRGLALVRFPDLGD